MVWLPRSATRSTMSRPWSLNFVMMVGRVLLGAGMSLLEPCTLAPRESLRPSGTIHPGPPVMTVESRAASARMSAQETVAGQAASSAALISSMTSKPLAESRLGLDRFSLTMDPLLSSSSEASQPLTKQSWKWRRRREAAMRGSWWCAFPTMDATMCCA
uniref:Uncharacterized protein n=1 Tax=Zea mays TaxID=4577 RepID=C4J4V3_MAIZE|nr:unknown [Zea mays]ACR36516.1 unknown [Zea mays]